MRMKVSVKIRDSSAGVIPRVVLDVAATLEHNGGCSYRADLNGLACWVTVIPRMEWEFFLFRSGVVENLNLLLFGPEPEMFTHLADGVLLVKWGEASVIVIDREFLTAEDACRFWIENAEGLLG